jgi:putative membrane protein
MLAIEVKEMSTKFNWLLAAVAVCSINAASAADTAPGLTAGERIFAERMAEGGLMEVKLGELAQQKAANQAVKDYSQANEELKALATAKGVQLPTDLGKDSKAMFTKISSKTGDAFDKDYMQHMLVDHRKDLVMLKIKHSDADLQAWQNKTLSVVEEHFKIAQDTNKQLMNSKASAK